MSSNYLQNAAKTMENISWKKVGIAAAVGGTAVVGAPVIASALGFKAGGIAAGSLAAKAMSSAAIANGGGIVTGSTVSVLQSVGVLGFYTKTSVLIATAASSGTALVTGVTKERNSEEVGGELGSKSVVDGASSKTVVDVAGGIMGSATTILGDVVKRSSSLWPGTTSAGSDTKKAD